MGVLQVGFSGGEPLLCPSIAELINVARENGLYSNLITSGLGLDSRKAKELKAAGLDTVQISFQADEAELADAIAGTRAHLKSCKRSKPHAKLICHGARTSSCIVATSIE